jgi:hypothetical protein
MVPPLLLLIAVAGCSRPSARHEATGTPVAAPAAPFQIGVMTGPAAQSRDAFRAGRQLEETYGSRVRHITYPKNFADERETVIAQLTGLAANTGVRVICVGQAVVGSAEAAGRIRASRPDMLIGLVSPQDDPDTVSAACDLAIAPDEVARGKTIAQSAQQMGAKHLVHYSFPRHMAVRLLARQRDLMRDECARHRMTFDDATMPDPAAGGGGLAAAQRFILDDVAARIGRLGPQTAFYATSDSVQEPLIRAILEHGGYFVEQAIPSPTAGYPEALDLSIPRDQAGDMNVVVGEVRRRLAEKGAAGRFGSWVAPLDMVALRAVTHLLVDAAEHRADLRDSATVRRYLEAETGGTPVGLRKRDPRGNLYLVTLGHVTY